MALRDQPYLPLYVQDFLTDEKLIECSAEATGVYIRLMCLMHKSEQYGIILLRQKDRQTGNQLKDFARKIAKAMPYTLEVIEAALSELILEKVIKHNPDTHAIIQPRMVNDNDLSEKRAIAGKEGNKKQRLAKQVAAAKPSANTEYENEYENAIESDNESEMHCSFVKSENLFIGAVPDDLRQLAERLQPGNNAGDWQKYVHAQVANLGYKVRREVPCQYADGADGRIDLVAEKGGLEIAIELDNRVPRKNSVAKIKQNYEVGMVLLRDPKFVKVLPSAPDDQPRRGLRKFSKIEIHEALFGDEIWIEQLAMTHRGKDLKQAFEECYTHHSASLNPPVEVWEWKHKLNTWLTIKGREGSNVKPQSKKKPVSYDQVK